MKTRNVDLIPEETREKVDRFWDDPQNIMNLIDLIFLNEDNKMREIVS